MLLGSYLPVLEREVAEPSSTANAAVGMSPRPADSPEPWDAPAGRALMDAHEGIRRLEARLRYELTGHPGRRRGPSQGNTAAALISAPKLAAGLGEDAEADAVRFLERLINEAEVHCAIDKAEQWRPLRSRACPRCGCFFLRIMLDAAKRPAGRVECFGHDESGAPCRAVWARAVEIVPDLDG